MRENAKEKDWSDEEYLAKLKEIRQMNAKEKRLLYEKYGRARYVQCVLSIGAFLPQEMVDLCYIDSNRKWADLNLNLKSL